MATAPAASGGGGRRQHGRAEADPLRRRSGVVQRQQRVLVTANVVGDEDDVEAELLGAGDGSGRLGSIVDSALESAARRGSLALD